MGHAERVKVQKQRGHKVTMVLAQEGTLTLTLITTRQAATSSSKQASMPTTPKKRANHVYLGNTTIITVTVNEECRVRWWGEGLLLNTLDFGQFHVSFINRERYKPVLSGGGRSQGAHEI
jgi:hypothetical protein